MSKRYHGSVTEAERYHIYTDEETEVGTDTVIAQGGWRYGDRTTIWSGVTTQHSGQRGYRQYNECAVSLGLLARCTGLNAV